jgi:hypothetical protein
VKFKRMVFFLIRPQRKSCPEQMRPSPPAQLEKTGRIQRFGKNRPHEQPASAPSLPWRNVLDIANSMASRRSAYTPRSFLMWRSRKPDRATSYATSGTNVLVCKSTPCLACASR